MDAITIQDIRRTGSKALPDDRTVYLIVNSKIKSAVVPIKDYEMMLASMEEMEDIKVIQQRKDEPTLSIDDVFGKR